MTISQVRVCILLMALTAIAGCADDARRIDQTNRAVAPTSVAAAKSPAKPVAPRVDWATGFPFFFEPNIGQADRRVRFLSRGPGYNLYLTGNEAIVTVPMPVARKPGDDSRARQVRASPRGADQAVLRIGFVGAASAPKMSASDRRSGVVHHQVGSNPAAWHQNIPTYGRVVHHDLYPGIDVAFRGGKGGPAYDFIVAPGARPSAIRLRFRTAERLAVDKNGDLLIRVAGREFRQTAPLIYQDIGGKRSSVSGGYVLGQRNEVGFRVGAYDRTLPLVIDPTLNFASLVGGGEYENAESIAVDGNGNVYVSAYSRSIDLPTLNGASLQGVKFDALTLKLDSSGAMVFVTYFGGNLDDYAQGIAVDSAGRVYVTGWTESDNFCTHLGQSTPSRRSSEDGFVVRLTGAGQRDYARCIGGNRWDRGHDIAVDGSGIYVTGLTGSSDLIPAGLPSPVQAQLGGQDAFVVKMDLDASQYVYATYLGGLNNDSGVKIAVNAVGEAHVVGWTDSADDFPTCSPPGPTTCEPGGVTARPRGAGSEVFVAKLNAAGTALKYATLLGGSGDEGVFEFGVALDGAGNAFVVATTSSSDLLPPLRPQAQSGGGRDAFLTKLDPNGAVLFSSYLGGTGYDVANDVALDPVDGKAWIAGYSPAAPAFVQSENARAGGIDGYVAGVAADGSAVSYWRYFGAGGIDSANAIATRAINGITEIYVAGYTESSAPSSYNFPVGEIYGPRGGQSDIFIVKLATAPPAPQLSLTKIATPPGRICVGDAVGYTVTLQNTGNVAANNVLLVDSFAGGGAIRLDQATGCNPPNPNATNASITCPSMGGTMLAPSEQRSFTFTGTAIAAGTALNSGVATANGMTPLTQSVSQTVEACVPPQPTMSVTQHWSRGTAEADPALNVSDPVAYTIEVRNTGNVPLTNVQVLDDFDGGGAVRLDPPAIPAGCNQPQPDSATALLGCPLGTLPPPPDAGAVRQITLQGRAVAPGVATNTVTVTAGEVAPQRVETHQTVSGRADLAIAMEAHDQPQINAPLTHLVVVTNQGPDPAAPIAVRVTLTGQAAITVPPVCSPLPPSGPGSQVFRCALTGVLDLDPATSVGNVTAFSFRILPAVATTLNLCAEIIERTDDPNTGNNRACKDWTIPPDPPDPPANPGLSIVNAVDHAPVRIGDPVRYKIGVKNTGNVALTNVLLQDTFVGDPKTIVLESIESFGAVGCVPISAVNPSISSFSCSRAELAPGEEALIVLHARATGIGPVTNTVTAIATEIAPQAPTDTLTHQIVASGNANLVIGLHAPLPAPVVNRSFAVYLTLGNGGPQAATSIRTTLTVSGRATVTSIPASCVLRGGGGGLIVECGTGLLGVGVETVLPIVLRPTEASPLFLEVEVEAAATFDPYMPNNRAAQSFAVSPAP